MDGKIPGKAFNVFDLLSYLEAVGLDPVSAALDDDRLFDWRGGGGQPTGIRDPTAVSALDRAGHPIATVSLVALRVRKLVLEFGYEFIDLGDHLG
ncbi:hypothetical protein [Streptomyces sp. 891-h]|uniref:hypothetical protein n=1 Tax=Streptomyces sp. 891-h TaxID=2720714 RepID=UPI001FA9D769|nr:hypothetical protein [Streptomyces sp. 891-h]